MDLRVRDVARILDVPESTVFRWAREGTVPCHRVNDEYRFNRVELQEWAAATNRRVSPELFADEGAKSDALLLASAVERGGVHYDVVGDDRDAALASVAALPTIPAGVDRRLLAKLLIAREAQVSTGIGEGIAIPHPRDPVVIPADEPFVLIVFLQRALDFGAIDGRPVRTLFVVLSPSVKMHLQVLARIALALRDDGFRALLAERASKIAILDRLRTQTNGVRPIEGGR